MGGDRCETSLEFHARESANVQQCTVDVSRRILTRGVSISLVMIYSSSRTTRVFLSWFIIDIHIYIYVYTKRFPIYFT